MNRVNGKEGRETNGIPRWKRVLDISLIVLVSPLLIPVALMVAAVIGLVSDGPIFFKQERIGWRGQKFICFKFRTMFVGAQSHPHEGHLRQLIQTDAPMIKLDSRDPRIIPFGGFLRSCGLDELPQLLNVLRGEMSLVGPRPCLPYEFEEYNFWQRERIKIAPGLTGLWQVSGKNRTTFKEMVRLDIEYGTRRSLLLDLEIIFKTIPALVIQMFDARKHKNSAARTAAPKVLAPKTLERKIFRTPAVNQ